MTNEKTWPDGCSLMPEAEDVAQLLSAGRKREWTIDDYRKQAVKVLNHLVKKGWHR